MSAVLKTDYSHIDDIYAYAESVTSGAKLACKQEIQACKRFFNDLEKDWQYEFNYDYACRTIRFIELLPHTKGKWARDKELLILQPWQKFIVGNIFGWINKDTGMRRFRKAFILAPRKQGKTPIASGIGLYMLCADGEHGAEVYCGANSEKQALEVFRPAKIMCSKRPDLKARFKIQIMAKHLEADNGGVFKPVIRNPGDGSSVSCGIADEGHEADGTELIDAYETGILARDQPLILEISTAGTNPSSPFRARQKEKERVLFEDSADDEFVMIFGIDEGDDWKSEQALIKANPNYGISVNKEILLAEQKKAIESPIAIRLLKRHPRPERV